MSARHLVPGRLVPWAAVLLWVVLAISPVRHLLEATMTRQMLVQLPLLVLVGWGLRALVPVRLGAALAPWNRSGITGIVLASVTAMVWMLPRALDAALEVPWVEVAKFASVPLLVGLPLAGSWPRAGFVVRGVALLETCATALRLGWLYLAVEQPLCVNYLVSDQARLGRLLLALGIGASLLLAGKLVWGSFATVPR